jgi:sugar lactone lactonase YvrE
MRRLAILPTLIAGLALPLVATAAPFPDRIDLPDDFAPEGIAAGRGSTFYAGSLAGAGIVRGDFQTGETDPLVEGGGPFVGMKLDARNRLWVAGGPLGNGYVFDAATGQLLETFAFGSSPTFVNDVVVTREAAYFTDSNQPLLYRVPIGPGGSIGEFETIALDPTEIDFPTGPFNLNGIDATTDGSRLIVVNSGSGRLFTIDPATGDAQAIDLGGASVQTGDGILLDGLTLYVVRNTLERLTIIRLAADLSSGTVVDELMLGELFGDEIDVPTTVARFGPSLYLVNARFMTADEPPVPYWITRVTP